MDLTPYVDNLRHELAVAAEAGGEDARAMAERLTAPLESAARLALLNVLSDAMGEVTRELAPGSVDVRLRGLDPSFVVTPAPGGADFGAEFGAEFGHQPEPGGSGGAPLSPPTAPPAVSSPAVSSPPDADEGGTSRINLRLPAHLKARAEEAAGREGLSLNAWLVRAVASAVDPDTRTSGNGQGPHDLGAGLRAGRGMQSFTGWVR